MSARLRACIYTQVKVSRLFLSEQEGAKPPLNQRLCVISSLLFPDVIFYLDNPNFPGYLSNIGVVVRERYENRLYIFVTNWTEIKTRKEER